MASYRDLSVLYRALQLAPIGTVLKLDGGLQIQHQSQVGNFLVLRRTHKTEHIEQAIAYLGGTTQAFVLDRSYDGHAGQMIDNVNDLAAHVEMNQRARNKIAMDLFGDYEGYDVQQGCTILANIVFGAVATPPPHTRKRVRAAECVVCLTEAATVMLNCGHECVCAGCCDEWMKVKRTCPVCQADVLYIYK
jgi:hypothetical protein